MTLEFIADKMDNPEHLYYTAKGLLGNIRLVRSERDAWMSAIPSEWLNDIAVKSRELASFWDSVKSYTENNNKE
jgi:hypothetical protein